MAWCARTWKKVSPEETAAPNITRDFLRPIRLKSAHDSYPIAVEWGEHAQMIFADQFVLFGSSPLPLYMVDLEVASVGADGSIDIRLSSEATEAGNRLTISDAYPSRYSHQKISGPDCFFKKSNGGAVPVGEHLMVDPVIVRDEDG